MKRKRGILGVLTILMGVLLTIPNAYALDQETMLIEEDTILNETFEITSDKNLVIDLNGKTITASSSSARKFINRGNLTIKNGTIKNTNSGAYGIIDNYGSLVVENVTFEDAGQGNGATIKNRPGSELLKITNSKFKNIGENLGNAGIYSDGKLVVKDTTFDISSNRAYGLIVNTGEATITNNTINGTHGGLGVNSGIVVVNGGTYTAKNYYGIWITNNDDKTNVTINSGKFVGKYGLYASVDDGNQDAGDATIIINDGEFFHYSGGKSAAAVNQKNSENTWRLSIKGGTFSTNVSTYVDDSYDVYKINDEKYVVDKKGTLTVKEGPVYIKAGETYDNVYTTNVEKLLKKTFDSSIIEVNSSNIKGLKAGSTKLSVEMPKLENSITKEIDVVVYAIEDTKVESKISDGREISEKEKEKITSVVSNIVKGVLEEKTDDIGIDSSLKSSIKENVLAGKSIGAEIVTDEVLEKDIKSDIELFDKVKETGYKYGGYYDIKINILADDSKIGELKELKNPLSVKLKLSSSLPKLKKGYVRIYTILRLHDGKVVKIKAKDNGDGTISFDSNKFSLYALTYTDVEEDKLDDVPKTGISIDIKMLLGLMIVGVCGLGIKIKKSV